MADFDLCIIGSGSGNTIVDDRFASWRVAIVDSAERYGGTCLNEGCLPTKMYVHPADLVLDAIDGPRLGVQSTRPTVDWPAIRDRVFGRIDPISDAGLAYRETAENVTVFRSQAKFVGDMTLEVGDQGQRHTITADRFVLAGGSRPYLPDVPGLDDPALAGRIHTSHDIMRLESLPKSLVILGGGAVATEFAHVFSAYGTRVTLVNRSAPLLRHLDLEIANSFTEQLSSRMAVRLKQSVTEVTPSKRGIRVYTSDEQGIEYNYSAERLLIAQGRTPNADLLDPAATGVEVDDGGRIVVDEHQQTTRPGIWALGDISNPYQLKHVANREARVVQHNLLHPDDLVATDNRFVPHAIFSGPQIAAVGKTEEELVATGTPYEKGVERFADVGYGWALEDEHSFAKVLAEPGGGQLLGVHIIGPQASTLIQPAIQAMVTGVDARTMARAPYWIHPALTEVLENALLKVAPDAG